MTAPFGLLGSLLGGTSSARHEGGPVQLTERPGFLPHHGSWSDGNPVPSPRGPGDEALPAVPLSEQLLERLRAAGL